MDVGPSCFPRVSPTWDSPPPGPHGGAAGLARWVAGVVGESVDGLDA